MTSCPHDQLEAENERLRQDVELWKGNYETLKSSMAVHQQDYDESQAKVERLRAALEARGPYCAQHGELQPCSQHNWIRSKEC